MVGHVSLEVLVDSDPYCNEGRDFHDPIKVTTVSAYMYVHLLRLPDIPALVPMRCQSSMVRELCLQKLGVCRSIAANPQGILLRLTVSNFSVNG